MESETLTGSGPEYFIVHHKKMVGIWRLISHAQKQHTIGPAIKIALNARVEQDSYESHPNY